MATTMITKLDEKNLSVAFLGPRGTYSQAAVIEHFGSTCELLECAGIEDVFAAVEEHYADFGVVPVENSTEGAINNTQDCLLHSSLKIIGEKIVSIEHNLLANQEADGSKIDTIASHQQSLAQCRHWLKKHYPKARQIECASNAEAALKAQKDSRIAAVAGLLAATIYDLKIVHASIQDQDHNSTRFLVLARQGTAATGNDKTSVLIHTENKPGALFRILQPFEKFQVSLSKIETRPSKQEAWEYVFFIDFEGHIQDQAIKELFAQLQQCTAEIKVLGSYPAAFN
ncbi:MAG TPA: prephenate dehydratase [Gammaproteobacteria bacterium]|nr:prephenate dehydratase [Gammaproteobacteria bacterium]HAT27058.1 prephenate dehydratase [Gammaproteobacteria bacterium]